MEKLFNPVRFGAFVDVSPGEVEALKSLSGTPRKAVKGQVIRMEGSPEPEIYFLLEGWTASSISLTKGQRQFVKIHLPGDVMGAPSLALDAAAESLTCLTPVVYAPVDLAALGRMFVAHPRLAALFFLAAQEERVILMERLASIGRLNANERVAAFIIHLYDRLNLLRPDSAVFDIPLTQEQIADAVGLTPVHVNRVLRQFDKEHLIERRGQEIRLADPEAFRKLSTLPKRTVQRDASWLPAAR